MVKPDRTQAITIAIDSEAMKGVPSQPIGSRMIPASTSRAFARPFWVSTLRQMKPTITPESTWGRNERVRISR